MNHGIIRWSMSFTGYRSVDGTGVNVISFEEINADHPYGSCFKNPDNLFIDGAMGTGQNFVTNFKTNKTLNGPGVLSFHKLNFSGVLNFVPGPAGQELP
ncbi:7797_t:CDS:2, partial [Funneliformis geosporum]